MRDKKRVVLFIAALGSFLTPFDTSAVNIALPTIGKEFMLDAITLGWISTAYLLASAVFLVPFGKLGDLYGRKKIFLAGIGLFATASFVISLSLDPAMIIALRFVQGIGSAMIFGTSLAMLTSVYPREERGKAIGITIMCVYLGLSLGPTLGGYMTDILGWRSIFWVNIPLGIIVIAMTLRYLAGEWKDPSGGRFDLIGAVIYGLSLSSLTYGLSLGPVPAALGFLVLAGAGIAYFVYYELKAPYPVLEIRLFSGNRVFTFSNLAALVNYSATFAVTFLMSLYLQFGKGFSAEYAGLILVAQPLTQAIFAPLAGRLSDRIEPRYIATAGMTLTAVGLLSLTFLSVDTMLVFIVGSLLFLGMGFGLFSSPNTNAIMSSVHPRYYGIASGMVGTMRLVGQMLSMGVAMMVFAAIIGSVQITQEKIPEFIDSIHLSFMIFFLLCVFGIFASLVRGNMNRSIPGGGSVTPPPPGRPE
ncbi:EmrB/QacA subfamily drug resistance transporter [Methanolinea mesophila]|uniref:MFS transporter n=1 Tax=Methanolinea mesophila TaxID=547055 RepID=UPI001FD85ED1|nr:MFS transporter [Methanolinea mesophila]MBP1927556.1 EmrB/QacA subfamily drug resistance transporter [Methanolinea mesophila]